MGCTTLSAAGCPTCRSVCRCVVASHSAWLPRAARLCLGRRAGGCAGARGGGERAGQRGDVAPLSRTLSAETAAAHQGLTHALLRSYAFLLAVNTVVGAGLFGVTDNGSLSNSYPTEVTPAGWTFAIWGTYEGAACPRAADLRARGASGFGTGGFEGRRSADLCVHLRGPLPARRRHARGWAGALKYGSSVPSGCES